MRGLLPNLLDEPSQRFRAGKPEDYRDGSVAFLDEIRTFLVREGDGFRAMSGICTHLGCTVNRADSGYRCPCHGSVFDEQGKVLSGPAPRPLDCYGVAQTRDGRLVIDRGRSVSSEEFLMVETRGQRPGDRFEAADDRAESERT
jgi:cytochrome b6-f complex iron-sulfur subunit